jgi:outer membrane protein TolC
MSRKWLLLSLLVFAACATTQPYESPRTTSLAQFTAYDVVERDGVQAIDWWTRFDDPVLNDLVAQALVANSDIRESLKRVEAVRAIHAAVRQEFLPRGGAVASQTREQLPGAGGDRHLESNAAGL